MALLAFKPRSQRIGPREFRYTREDYAALGQAGLFDHVRVELMRGRLVEMPAIGEEHGTSSLLTARALRRIFPEEAFTVRPSLSFIAADDSQPQPDLCVVAGPVEAGRAHPSTCLLLIEIAHTTLAYNRGEKATLYAESGVADYWIVNLVDRVLEVRREPRPGPEGGWAYASTIVVRPGETCTPLAAAAVPIDPRDLLPMR